MNACFKFEMVENHPWIETFPVLQQWFHQQNCHISIFGVFDQILSPNSDQTRVLLFVLTFNFWRNKNLKKQIFSIQKFIEMTEEETVSLTKIAFLKFPSKIYRTFNLKNKTKNLSNGKTSKKSLIWKKLVNSFWSNKNQNKYFFQSFDPSLKKKKKKKKTPFDLDGALNDAEGDNETPEPAKDENLDDLDLENFGKKKKKKKKVGEGDEEKGDKEKDESEDIDLESFGKKKKPKKKKNINLDELKEALDDDNKENGKVF